MSDYMQEVRFADVDLSDPFFDSLKEDYPCFEAWVGKKGEEPVYVLNDEGSLAGFMYVKVEDGGVDDVEPPLPPARRIKIGTLKVNAHGTRMGERFVKKALDHAVVQQAEELYLTAFSKHKQLLGLLEQYGFEKAARKCGAGGEEDVYVKRLGKPVGDIWKDYPLIVAREHQKFLLAIQPEWHTQLFPDSILNSEPYDILNDVSHTNSIQKTYVCFMDLSQLRPGDIIVIYRMKDSKGPAEYRSVVTSVCTTVEVRFREDFGSAEDYVKYTEPYSVFNRGQLLGWWQRRGKLYVVKLLYNAAFTKRLIRKKLADQFGLDRNERWGFLELTDGQFRDIVEAGGIDERLVVD